MNKRIGIWMMAGLTLAGAAARGEDWPQLQKDARRSGYTDEVVKAPYQIRWRWHPVDPTVGIAGQVQPVIAGGRVYVGAMDGGMYALDEKNGKELWKFQTGAPILGTAAATDKNVYFGGFDGWVYAVGGESGKLLWKLDTHGSISASPLLAEGTLFIGNRQGRFFGIDAEKGAIRWQWPAEGAKRSAPFLTSAAFADGVVYTANEACQAIAFGTDGTVKWTAQIKGQSVPWWPVVSSKNGVVIYRTQPVYDHTLLREASYKVLEQEGGKHTPDGPTPGTPEQRQREQENVREYLKSDPFLQTCWVLNVADGTEKFPAPILYQAGGGGSPTPPVIREETGEAWTSHCSYFSPFDGTSFVQTGWYVDFGRIDLKTGRIYPMTGPKQWEAFHLVADESSFLSMMGDTTLFAGWISAGSWNVKEQKGLGICFTQSTEDKNESGMHAEGGAWTRETLKSAGGSDAAAAVANRTIYWIAPRGLLVAIETKR